MTNIRQARLGDESLVEHLLKTKVEELREKEIIQWDNGEVSWDNLKNEYEIGNFYIAFVDDEAVGCFCVVSYDPTYWYHDQPGEFLYIHKVMVLNKVAGQGIADQMLTHFKELGKQKGLKTVKLDVRAHKEKLRSFYERNGFELVEVTDLGKGYMTALYKFDV